MENVSSELVALQVESNRRMTKEINELVKALASAQGSFEIVKKDVSNPYYNSKYADLAGIIEATQPALSKNGLVIIQSPVVRDDQAGVITILAHSSGQWISNELLLPGAMKGKDGAMRFDAQSVGSAITYARRYAYQSIIGVAAEIDDDGNKASGIGSKEAAQAVGEKKVADYKAKSAAQVKGKTLEYYPHKFGVDDAIVFLPSDALAVMLENGLKDIAQYSDTVKARWIVDDPEPLAILDKIAAQLSITCKRVFPPSLAAPTAKYQEPPSRPDSFPILHKAEVMKGKKGPYLSVVWGETKAQCFRQHIWEALQAGAGAKQPADLKTEMNGAYTNIVDIYQIGEREYLEGAPVRRTDDVGPMKFY